MINTVLFDFDGVIADSVDSIFKWFQHAASIFNVDLTVKNTDELKDSFMEPYPELYKYLGFDWNNDQQDIFNEYLEYHGRYPVTLVEGIEFVMEELTKIPNMKLGIVSSNEQGILDDNLSKHDLAKYFDVVIGMNKEQTIPLKPDPTSLLKALDILGSSINDSVYIGDQPSDVLTAQNASKVRLNSIMMKTISLTTGFATRQKLESTLPTADHILDHPKEILSKLGF